MGYQDDHLVFQEAFDAVIENVVGNLWVDGTEWIIQKIDISFGVNSPGQTDSCFLSARYVDTSFSYYCIRAIRKLFDIPLHL